MVFSSSHVQMWELDHKKGWALKKCCFWTEVLQKTLESPLDCKEIKPVHPKGDQLWILIGRTDTEAKAPILGPPDVKSWLNWKRPWCWERLRAGGEGDNREWDGWMASLTQWTWVCINSRSWWCHPTISSSVVPLSSCVQFSQHQGLSKWVSSSHQVAKVLEFQLQHQSFQWIFRSDFL